MRTFGSVQCSLTLMPVLLWTVQELCMIAGITVSLTQSFPFNCLNIRIKCNKSTSLFVPHHTSLNVDFQPSRVIEFALWSMAVSPFVSAPSFSLNWDNVSEAIKRECWQTSNLLSRDNEAQALLHWRNMFDIYSPFEERTNLPQSLQPLQNMITALSFFF